MSETNLPATPSREPSENLPRFRVKTKVLEGGTALVGPLSPLEGSSSENSHYVQKAHTCLCQKAGALLGEPRLAKELAGEQRELGDR